MKHVLNFLKSIVITLWILMAVFTTICLISYNDYKVSELGNYSLVIVDNDELEPTYKEGDLVIVKKQSEKNYAIGDYIFFYTGSKTLNNFVNFAQITDVQKAEGVEASYNIGDTAVSYTNVIGKGNGSIVYHHAGRVLSILESRWGYMFIVILPTLFAFVYEIYAIVMEVKREAKKEIKDE